LFFTAFFPDSVTTVELFSVFLPEGGANTGVCESEASTALRSREAEPLTEYFGDLSNFSRSEHPERHKANASPKTVVL
jgi:hypothetical protein